jgi:phosphoglycerate dehydrogenase-like enzyme
LLAAGVILRINRSLSRRALNNGVGAKFDWDKEIVLVTGGAGGIGAEAAQRFAARGSKVIVLDVLPLTYPKRTAGCFPHRLTPADIHPQRRTCFTGNAT